MNLTVKETRRLGLCTSCEICLGVCPVAAIFAIGCVKHGHGNMVNNKTK